MVVLVVPNLDDIFDLEQKLVEADMEYQLCLDYGSYGIKPPHLIIDSVPLDYKRSLIWIKEHSKHE